VAETVEIDERPLTANEIKAKIAEAKRKRDEANIKRDTKGRRKAEHKQGKSRVNQALLRGQGGARDEVWSFRAKPSHIRDVKALAKDLSQPGAKVSVAALMDQAVELLLARYRGDEGDGHDA
jgi:hypothetical protein